jgi:hypothetical protein
MAKSGAAGRSAELSATTTDGNAGGGRPRTGELPLTLGGLAGLSGPLKLFP